MREKTRCLTYAVFGIYLLLLLWMVLFKFATSVDDILGMRHARYLNLIPFTDSANLYGSNFFDEIVVNFLIFIPFGLYMRMLLKRRSWLIQLLPPFLASVAFEVVQYVFAIGVSDITDVIMNTAGAATGLVVFALLARFWPEKSEKVINVIGLVLEILFVGFLTFLIIANS